MTKFVRDLNRVGTGLSFFTALLVADRGALGEGAPPDLLAEGQLALVHEWHALAYRRCRRAAAEARGKPRRIAALLCQGRAALGLKWPQQAVHLGLQVLRLQDTGPAHLLIGDGYRALDDCRSARPHYLIVLERDPRSLGALAGLHSCAVEWPPPPDSQPPPQS